MSDHSWIKYFEFINIPARSREMFLRLNKAGALGSNQNLAQSVLFGFGTDIAAKRKYFQLAVVNQVSFFVRKL